MLLSEDGTVIARTVRFARSPVARAKGLLWSPPLRAGEALVIDGARQVHTFGMRYAIDVVFCDGDWLVKHVIRAMKPKRISRWVSASRYVIELPAMHAELLVPGQRVVFQLPPRDR